MQVYKKMFISEYQYHFEKVFLFKFSKYLQLFYYLLSYYLFMIYLFMKIIKFCINLTLRITMLVMVIFSV